MLGGLRQTRELLEDRFERDVNEAIGDRVRASDEDARALWSALANVDWKHESGDEAGYSFRAAGDLIAALRKSGDYMDWYCCGEYAQVAEWISEAMAARGWTHKEME